MDDQHLIEKLDRRYRSFLNHGFLVRVDRQKTVDGRLRDKFITPSGGFVVCIEEPITHEILYLFADQELCERVSVQQRLTVSYCDCLITSYTLYENDKAIWLSECFPKNSADDRTTFFEPHTFDLAHMVCMERADPKIVEEVDRKYRSFLKHGFKVRADRRQSVSSGTVVLAFTTPSGGKCLVIYDYHTSRFVYLLADEELYDEITYYDSVNITYCECLILSYEIATLQGSNDITFDYDLDQSVFGVCYPKAET